MHLSTWGCFTASDLAKSALRISYPCSDPKSHFGPELQGKIANAQHTLDRMYGRILIPIDAIDGVRPFLQQNQLRPDWM
jgi:hypothetical protein